MGSHEVGFGSMMIIKNIVNSKGNIVRKYDDPVGEIKKTPTVVHAGHAHEGEVVAPQPNYEEVKLAIKNGEGCHLMGSLDVLKVPGNFHISSHAYSLTIGKLANEGLYNFDLTHTINHISFGKEDHIRKIIKEFGEALLNPIDNTSKYNPSDKKMIYEYYLNVVPTKYIDLNGNSYDVHQFTANSNEIRANMMVPTVFFRYDLSPILVKYVQTRERIYQFFIEICAIIGGVYMVTSMILSILINSSHIFFKSKNK